MKQEGGTEDDTYNALKRIPFSELQNTHGALILFIRSVTNTRRIIQKEQEKIDKRNRRWGWLIGKAEPYWISDLPTVNSAAVNETVKHTGWTCKDIIKEINGET